jgi:hypothetical protein
MLDERTEALRAVMLRMREDARDAMARGLTTSGDVVEDVAAWEISGDLTTLARVSGDLTAEDALLAVQVFDAFLNLAEAMQGLPGAIAMNDATRRKIKDVRQKVRGMIG